MLADAAGRKISDVLPYDPERSYDPTAVHDIFDTALGAFYVPTDQYATDSGDTLYGGDHSKFSNLHDVIRPLEAAQCTVLLSQLSAAKKQAADALSSLEGLAHGPFPFSHRTGPADARSFSSLVSHG